jgi:hypothetical protein
MKLRTFLVAIAILGMAWHPAAAQPRKNCRGSSVLLDQVQSTTLGSNDLVRHPPVARLGTRRIHFPV